MISDGSGIAAAASIGFLIVSVACWRVCWDAGVIFVTWKT